MSARPPTDVFRPCLPLDPFAAVDPGPWRPSISPHADPPSAVLVLGEPTLNDLHPILFSQSLVQSLIVLATHAPPYIPQTPLPAVRILRLSTPLAQDSGALRLASLLERADRVVRRFRASDRESSRKLVQLAENELTGEFVVEEPYAPPSLPPWNKHQAGEEQDLIKRYPSPAPSITSSISSSSSTLSNSSSAFSESSPSSPFSSHRLRRRSRPPPSSCPPPDRAFDAIINFLPSSLPDKALLKYAILVSTLTSSFFAAPPAPRSLPTSCSNSKSPEKRLSIFSNLSFTCSDAHFASPAKSESSMKNPRRFSTFLRRRQDNHPNELVHSAPCSRDSLLMTNASHLKGKFASHHPQTPETQRKAHLIHILPSHMGSSSRSTGASGANGKSRRHHQKSKPKLAQSIEQFLLAFGYPLHSMSLLPSASASAPASRRISTVSTDSTFMSAASISGDTVGQEKPVPFLLPAGVLGSMPCGGKMTIGEILLMGGLDPNDENGGGLNGTEGSMGMGGIGVGEGRVWIASAEDVVWDDPEGLSISNVADFSRNDPRHAGSSSVRRIHSPVPANPISSAMTSSWRSSSYPPPSVPTASAKPRAMSPPALGIGNSASKPMTTATTPQTSAPAFTEPVPSRRTWSRGTPLYSSANKKAEQEQPEQQQLPTPPESSSSLEDETETSPPTSRQGGSASLSGDLSPAMNLNMLSPSMTNSDVSVSEYHEGLNDMSGCAHHTGAKAVGGVKTGKMKGLKGLGLGKALKGFGRLVSGGGGTRVRESVSGQIARS